MIVKRLKSATRSCLFGGGPGPNGLYAFRLGAEGTPPGVTGTPASDVTPTMAPRQEQTPPATPTS